ncbi:RF-1 domain protein [Leptospira interrogans serovar Grippotyphosa str. 2006006986]|uniref:Peptidyl-tRNA hydrolase involved in peptide chain release n=1 Tax=Leptospira interrogans serogroup Icterohaemorrhagiae serovar Lai (strain 56601) TaxID=189518 RepID=Q8F480_LEPIN|nr:peptide chain release factor-like protein [Leptospira interrogans]AAN49364.1 peptidyl-tRNA hydrolase involved in peptide chain release [Leptospira interrogans serovar Lai str. 56601]AER02557.1 peptidyl-tRNA hydrolase involved in peptide chain release [Leptospira interrogans serovar Lai str. IPAV]EKO87957.1 RF-1 domain protein [Leptospira interrogans serovar Grippotyphosa str. Andaman]EKP87747.1 RF-1 domain protein [Leptospira interrogans serovar Grippotyphosa str. 2006006986]
MASRFPVSVEKESKLLELMEILQIKETELEESFTRSGGKGGQNVNKVSTAVHLRHKPTGIEVKCSLYRTQGLNRYKARAILCEKIRDFNHKNLGIISEDQKKLIRNKQKDSKRKKEKYSRKNQSFSTVFLEEDKNFEVEWKEVKNEEERRSTEPD